MRFKRRVKNNLSKFITSGAVMLFAASSASPVYADEEKYLVLGQDLTESEKQTVLNYFGISDISTVNVSYVTHQDEKNCLGNYLPASVIGSRALSSVLMEKQENGSGISVNTNNITYCTDEMYQNALITAGAKDLKMTVTAPMKISGTAALVAATKSYEIMTGKKLNTNNVDTANQELAVTQEAGQKVGKKEAADLVASLKQKVAAMGDDYTREDGQKSLSELEKNMGVTLDQGTENNILDLMDKMKDVNLDEETVKEQAKNVYDSIKGYADKIGANEGMLSAAAQKVKDFIQSIIDFFK